MSVSPRPISGGGLKALAVALGVSLVYLVEGAVAIVADLDSVLLPFLVVSADSVLDFLISTEWPGVSIATGTKVSLVLIERDEDGDVLGVFLGASLAIEFEVAAFSTR